jgi:ribonuclease HI
VFWSLALRIEGALLDGSPLVGISLDYRKCFDLIPHNILLRLVEDMGLSEQVSKPLRTMYANLRRRFRLGSAVGSEFVSTNGILQGCPLSVVLLNALVSVWCKAVEVEVPQATPEAFADDTGATAKKIRHIQSVGKIAEEFAAATGQELNETKSCWFHTSARKMRNLTLKGKPVPRAKVWKSVGARMCSRRGRTLGVLPIRVSSACRVADRICWLPLPLPKRAALTSALVLPRGTFGCAASGITKKQCQQLRGAALKAIWGTKRGRRCPEIVLTLFAQGHRVDPYQVAVYQSMTTFRSMMLRRPDLLTLFESVWDSHRQTRILATGPVSHLRAAVARLGWRWPSPWTFLTEEGCEVQPLQMPQGEWEHVLRESARKAEWRTAAARRSDMSGIEHGIDRDATLALLSGNHLVPFEQGILRGILAGAIWTQDRAQRSGRVASSVCEHCNTGEMEDHSHMWWRCPAWDGARQQHWQPAFSSAASWPPCLSICGIVPDNFNCADGRAAPVVDLTGSDSERDAAQQPRLTTEVETACEGRVVVYIDGAARDNQRRNLRRAGLGAYWGKDHAWNVSEALLGPVQTNNRAELAAVIRTLEIDKRPLDIRTDSKYVFDGVAVNMVVWENSNWKRNGREVSHKDLWQRLSKLLSERQPGQVTVKKIKATLRPRM